MSAYTYWPYDEVSLELPVHGMLTVKTPWMEATTSSTPFSHVNLSAFSARLNNKNLSPDDLGVVNEFFGHFHQYPLAYILPTPKSGSLLDKHTIVDATLLEKNLEEILELIQRQDLLPTLSRRTFEWDTDAALGFASVDNKIHPESIFSIARRYHILELMSNDKGLDVFRNVKASSPEQFKMAACRLVRQNHYVTEKCQEALAPAIALAGQSAHLVADFMKEERGHDKILKKALQHLEVSPEDIAVTAQTQTLMAVLKYIAGRNFLAFAMAIDAFERNNFEDVDPIAQLLLQGGYEKAAEFINLHMKINDHGNHDNVAQKFLQSMDLCEHDYALEALRLMEVLSVVMCGISQSAEF